MKQSADLNYSDIEFLQPGDAISCLDGSFRIKTISKNGRFEIEPGYTDEQKKALEAERLKQEAINLLNRTDYKLARAYERAQPVPAKWSAWRDALREVAAGRSDTLPGPEPEIQS